MRVVSENSPAEVARQRALDALAPRLRELAANMLRVVRGAGRPEDIGLQVRAVLEQYVAYQQATGHLPYSEEIASALDFREELKGEYPEQEVRMWRGKQMIVRGSLQFAASVLLGQNTQRASGAHEMFSGLELVEGVRDENRRARLAQEKPAKKRARPPPPWGGK